MPQDHEWTIALNKWFTLSVGLAHYRILPAWGVHKILHVFFQQRRCWIAKKIFSATGQQQVIQDPKAKTEDV